MKIRTNFVSNSSSSSYIIWGKGAYEFINSLEDFECPSAREVGNSLYWECIGFINAKETSFEYIDDQLWIEKFNLGDIYSLHHILPNGCKSFKGYNVRDQFEQWFNQKFENVSFYQVTGSDHSGETIYHEDEVADLFCGWNGPHLYVNQH